MADWREEILEQLPLAHPINIVFDPDGILNDLTLQSCLREIGFDILLLKDRMDLRYQYESNYRERLEFGEKLSLLIIIPGSVSERKNIPWDLLKYSYIREFTARDIAPSFSYSITGRLPIQILEKLHKSYEGRNLNERETIQRILSIVYDIDIDNLRTETNLYAALIKLSIYNEAVPNVILNYLIIELSKKPFTKNIPIKQFMATKTLLLNQLQKLWEQYIICLSSNEVLQIDLGEEKIRKELIVLFIEGQLNPVYAPADHLFPKWVMIGIDGTPESSSRTLLPLLLEKISHQLKTVKNHTDWQSIALLWAEAENHHGKLSKDDLSKITLYESIHNQIEEKFADWDIRNQPSLYSLSLSSPVTVSQIADHLSYSINRDKKIALIVIDCLSLDQWLTIKNWLNKNTPRKFLFNERTVFAAIPTLTSISRQSIFSGKEPIFIEEYLESPKEEQLWKTYWKEKNITASLVKALKLTSHEDVEIALEKATTTAIGIIVSWLDETVHRSTLDRAALTSQLEKWIEHKHLTELLKGLMEKGYSVYIASDHGNVESIGQGTIRQGSLVEQPGSRVRIYTSEKFADECQERYPDAIKWVNSKRSKYIYILASGRRAFIKEGETTITHGGITLEEMVVPFIEVKQENEP